MYTTGIEAISGFGMTGTKMRLSVVNFQLFSTSIELYYAILTEDESSILLEGRVSLTDLTGWGEDDMFVVDAAIAAVNTERGITIVKVEAEEE